MIKSLNYSLIPSDELYTFVIGTINIIEPKSELFSYMNPFLVDVKEKQTHYQQALTRFSINPYTEKLHAADANLDRSFRALKYYIEAVQFRKDEGWKEAAAKMEATIRIYGWTANDFGYKAQIAAMLNIVKEFDDKFGTQIELIEALAWYTPFKTNLLELVNLYNESASYIPANDATIKDTRQPLVDSIRSLLQIIELMGQHNPSDEHTALEDAINEHITRSMASVKAAITRDANNKAEQEPETLQ